MSSKDKKMKIWLYLSLLISSFLSVNAYAGNPIGEVSRIYPSGSYIKFKLKNDSCSSGSYYYFKMTNQQSENWFAMLLTSAHSRKPIIVRLVGDANACYPTVEQEVAYLYQDF